MWLKPKWKSTARSSNCTTEEYQRTVEGRATASPQKTQDRKALLFFVVFQAHWPPRLLNGNGCKESTLTLVKFTDFQSLHFNLLLHSRNQVHFEGKKKGFPHAFKTEDYFVYWQQQEPLNLQSSTEKVQILQPLFCSKTGISPSISNSSTVERSRQILLRAMEITSNRIFPCKYPLYPINIGFECFFPFFFPLLQKSSSQKQKADFPGKLNILYFTFVNVFPLLKKCYLQNQHRILAYKLFSVLYADVQTQGRSWFLFNCWLLWCITEKHFLLYATETTPDCKIIWHDMQFKQASQKFIGFLYQCWVNKTRKTFLKIMIFLAVATVFVSISSIASILNKPRWTLPGSFNDPLAFIFFCGLFSIIKYNSLYSWSFKWSSFLFMYFHPYQSSFCFDLCITIATKDVFLFQVSTLGTNIYVPLKKIVESMKFCHLNNTNKRNREQSQTTKNVKWNIREIQLPFQNVFFYVK